ncbi:hypothetical protein LCGC14_2639630, partial [marine sediment metagenome]
RDALATGAAILIDQAGIADAINVSAARTILDGTQSVQTSGSPTAFLITSGAHTTLDASTEATTVNWDLSANVEWATGDFTPQRFFRIQAPTMDFVAGSTVAAASTLAVSGAPIAGAFATLTRSFAINAESGMIVGAAGTAIAPTFGFNDVAGVGMRRGAGNRLAFAVSSSDRLSITVTQLEVLVAGTAASPAIGRGTAGNTGIFFPTTTSYAISTTGVERHRIDANGNVTFDQGAQTSGSPTALTVTGGAHTTLDVLTEATDIDFDLARAVEFTADGGAFALQRAISVKAPTYEATIGGTTITQAVLMELSGSPIAGTNMTLTDSATLRIKADSIAALTPADGVEQGILLENSTIATAGNQKHSPILVFEGQGWSTDGTGETREVQFGTQLVPIQGVLNPTGELRWYSAVNNPGAWTEQMALSSSGIVRLQSAQALGGGAAPTLGTIGGAGPG